MDDIIGLGTRENPWTLKTPNGQLEFQVFCDEALNPPALVVQVGKTEVRYQLPEATRPGDFPITFVKTRIK